MKHFGYVVLLLVAVALTAGCVGNGVDAAVEEIEAALDAQKFGLEYSEEFDLEVENYEYVVTVRNPARIQYAAEKFAESAERARTARALLESALEHTGSKDEIMVNGQYYEVAANIEVIAGLGLDQTAELQQPEPDGSQCVAYERVIILMLEDQPRNSACRTPVRGGNLPAFCRDVAHECNLLTLTQVEEYTCCIYEIDSALLYHYYQYKAGQQSNYKYNYQRKHGPHKGIFTATNTI